MDRPSRLRRLIGALELRCELLGDGTESMYLGADRIRLNGADVHTHLPTLEERERQIRMVEQLLWTMRQEVTEIRTTSARRHNWTQPAISVPVEILRRIFEIACSPNRHDFVQITNFTNANEYAAMICELRHTRQAISSVCSHWRDVAHRDSALWSDIALHCLVYRRMPSYDQFLDEVALSGARELSVHLILDADSEFSTLFRIEYLKKTCTDRVVSFDMFVARAAPDPENSPVFPELGDFSDLRTLRLGLEYAKRFPTEEQEFAVIDLGPMRNLRELVLDCMGSDLLQDFRMDIRPPSSCNITRLVLWSELSSDPCVVFDVEACINLINSCRHLEKLDWSSGVLPIGVGDFGLDIKSQNYLTELSIAGVIPWSFLPEMHYPNLLKLRIHDFPEFGEDTQNDRTRACIHGLFGTAKFPKLRHLDQRLCEHPRIIIPFLQAHPLLEELVLWCDIDEVWVDGLAGSTPSSISPLPSLTRVWTNPSHDCVPTTCTRPSTLHVEELLRRWALHRGTQPFTLHLHPEFHGPNVPPLAALYNKTSRVTVEEGTYKDASWYRYDHSRTFPRTW